MVVKVQKQSNRQRALILYVIAAALAALSMVWGHTAAHASPLGANDNFVSRARVAQQVSNAAGFHEDPGAQIFEDVAPNNHYYQWINRLANRGVMGGYICGTTPQEPCVAPANRPYFRPDAEAFRGQVAKIVSNAAGFGENPSSQSFEDSAPGTTFYVWVQRLADRSLVTGFACGTTAYEQCVAPDNRPYFRCYGHMLMPELTQLVNSTFGGLNPASGPSTK